MATQAHDLSIKHRFFHLEQVVYILQNSQSREYLTGTKIGKTLSATTSIDIKSTDKFKVLLNALNNQEVELGLKIRSGSKMLSNYATNSRGGSFQNMVKNKGKIRVLGGAQVQRFYVTNNVKGYIDNYKIIHRKARVQQNAILVQNIMAHIKRPVERTAINACIADFSNTAILDTVNQLIVTDIDPYYILGLLNSKLINWYAYRFIFCKAARTIKFDNPTTSRIPVEIDNVKHIVQIVKNLITLHNVLQHSTTSTNTNNVYEQHNVSNTNKHKKDTKFCFNLNSSERSNTNLSLAGIKRKDIMQQIRKYYSELNAEIFSIYNLTASEIDIINNDVPDYNT